MGHTVQPVCCCYFWEIAGLLADLEEQSGNKTAAAGLQDEARTILETIIEQIPEGELRASFVALTRYKLF